MVYCKECDYPLWKLEDKKLKLCPDCRGDDESDCQDLEDSLDEIFGDDYKQIHMYNNARQVTGLCVSSIQ